MVRLFLDANILLDFFRFGADDLIEVRKLITLIEDDEVKLFSNQLLRDEVGRARDAEIAKSLEELRAQKFNLKAPNYCSELTELADLKEALKTANQLHSSLLTALKKKISSKSIDADILLADLNEKTSNIEITPILIERAEQRQMFNNPPRKRNDSVGDSLHWEALLSTSYGYDFHIVSRDGDFSSDLEATKMKDFLQDEWKTKFGEYASITLHKSLSNFFREKFPNIKLSEEAEKSSLISELQSSGSFTSTHDTILKLGKFENFTNGQVRRLFQALVENSQVNWIASDDDVHSFYMKLEGSAHIVPIEDHSIIAELLGKSDFFDIPF
jgi:hypothetical protein